ncbi:MAG: serine acetyltransferase [Pseudomonadota bacterium]
MLFKLIVALFGSAWELKRHCMDPRRPLLQRLMIRLWAGYQYENGSSVAWNAEFEDEPCFPHGMKSIFISGGAQIGRRAVIFQQVTIGSNTLAGSPGFGAPMIGDHCYIGAGAKIIGRVHIGDHVRIGANAVVYQDVPDNSVVLCGEQRIVRGRQGADNRFFSMRGQWRYFEDGAWITVTDPQLLARLAPDWKDNPETPN